MIYVTVSVAALGMTALFFLCGWIFLKVLDRIVHKLSIVWRCSSLEASGRLFSICICFFTVYGVMLTIAVMVATSK